MDIYMDSIMPYLSRYTKAQEDVICLFLGKLALATRKTGHISESRQAKIVASFEAYDVDVVIDSLNTYLAMDISQTSSGKGKNEKYVCGIMANKQSQKGGRTNGVRRNSGSKSDANGKASQADEGERLQQLAESTSSGKLDCDF